MRKILFLILIILSASTFSYVDIIDKSDQKSILANINAYRAKYRLEPLKINNFISNVALNHSRNMAEDHIPFGHAGFRERTIELFKQFKHARAIAENVAYTDFNARSVIKLWLNSPGHRKNIKGNYNLTGIGIASDKNGRVYVTQIFLYE
jgi:uncharacterized protein YkwD